MAPLTARSLALKTLGKKRDCSQSNYGLKRMGDPKSRNDGTAEWQKDRKKTKSQKTESQSGVANHGKPEICLN